MQTKFGMQVAANAVRAWEKRRHGSRGKQISSRPYYPTAATSLASDLIKESQSPSRHLIAERPRLNSNVASIFTKLDPLISFLDPSFPTQSFLSQLGVQGIMLVKTSTDGRYHIRHIIARFGRRAHQEPCMGSMTLMLPTHVC